MSRRTRTTASLLVLLLALVVVAPALPVVREALITRALGALDGLDVTVEYGSSSGNAWRSIALHDVEIDGLGADVQVETLRLGYFLPSLLGGELPIDVLVHGATGTVDLEQVLDASVGDASGTGAGPVSVRLRKIDLQDIGVDIARAPFELPDANISSLSVTQDGTSVQLAGVVTTADGEATLDGRYDALTGTFTAHIDAADATIAQHWWSGVTGGSVTGTLSVRGSTVDGDFTLTGGSVDYQGLVATDVSGPVTMRYPVITAELTGATLGGDIDATGVVNVVAKRWEANGGGTADLAAAADWLARRALPEGVPLAIEGLVDVDLTVVGWRDVDLRGSASGSGAVEDMALEDLTATFTLDPDTRDVNVDATASLGGGPVTFTMGPARGGETIAATLTGVALAMDGEDYGRLDASLTLEGDEDRRGTLVADWSADLLGRDLAAQVDAHLDPDGWQAFITAQDGLGTTAEGAVVLADGRLDGAITATDVAGLPLSPGARVVLSAAGPVDALTATISVAGDQPVTLTAGPTDLTLVPDLRGSVAGTLDGARWEGLSGSFGPIGVGGAVTLAPVAANLDVSVAPLTIAYGDTASATLSTTTGALSYADGALTFTGTATSDGVTLGPLLIEAREIAVTATVDGAEEGVGPQVTLNGDAGRLVVLADRSGFRLSLDDLPVTSAAPDLSVDARVSGTVTPTTVSDATSLVAAVSVARGSTFGPVTLADDLVLDGAADLANRAARFTGSLAAHDGSTGPAPGSVGLTADADWAGDEGATVTASLTTSAGEPLAITYRADTGAFAIDGAVEPGILMSALGLLTPEAATSFAATATSDLRGTLATGPAGAGLSDLTGAVRVRIDEPLPLTAELSGAGTALDVFVSSTGSTGPLTTSGLLEATGRVDMSTFSAVADAGLTVSLGPLTDVQVTADGANGEGVLDPTALGAGDLGPLTIEPVPWQLTAAWAGVDAPYATLASGSSTLTLTLAGGQPQLAGDIQLPLTYAGQPLELRASVRDSQGGPVPLDQLAAVPLSGTLSDPSTGSTLLAFDGSVAELRVSGSVPTSLLAAPLPAGLRPAGELRVDGSVDVLAGPSFVADVSLTASDAAFTGHVTGTGSAVTAALSGAGLDAAFAGDTLRITAERASLAPLLPATGVGGIGAVGTLDGTLLHDSAGWSGALAVDVTVPLDDLAAEPAEGPETGPETGRAGAVGGLVATVTLIGRGDTLELAAAGTGPAATTFEAAGTLTPELTLNARVGALDDAVTADLTFTTGGGLTGTVTSSAFTVDDYATVPPQTAAVTWSPGAPLRLDGQGIAVTADLNAPNQPLDGAVTLPFTLLDAPATLTAAVRGSVTAPEAEVEVTGTGLHVSGTGTLEAADATLTVTGPAIDRLLPAAAAQVAGRVSAPVTAQAHWTTDAGWTLGATSLIEVPTASADGEAAHATIELDLAGEGARYAGGVGIRLDGQSVAAATIAGVGSDLTADLDLATIAWSTIAERFGVDADVAGGGHARLTTEPLDATLAVDLRGSVAGMAVTLRGSAPNDLAFTVAGDAVDLTGRVAWDEQERAVVTGTVDQRPVNARLTLDDALTSGRLVIDMPGVRVVADLSTDEPLAAGGGGPVTTDAAAGPRRDVAVTAELDGSAFGGVAGSLTAALSVAGGVTEIHSLHAAAETLPGLGSDVPLTLNASGVVTPTVSVVGTLTAPTLGEEAPIAVHGRPDTGTTVATLTWNDLLAAYDLASGRLHLTGSAALGDTAAPFLPAGLAGLRFDLEDTDLTWSAEHGFGGGFQAAVDAPALAEVPVQRPLRVTATATSPSPSPEDLAETRMDLTISVAANVPARAETGDAATPLAVAHVVVPADVVSAAGGSNDDQATSEQAAGLTGGIDVDADLADLLGLPEVSLRLTATAALAGTLNAPKVTGEVRLDGDVAAAGTLTYVDGVGALDLRGPELRVSGSLDDSGWAADAVLDRLPLGTWLTQVADPYLSLEASADSGTGTRVIVENLLLESDDSSLSGGAAIDTGLRVLLQAQVNLADLRLGETRLHGLMRGPVVLTAPTLTSLSSANVTAQLDAAGVGIDAFDASVSGSLQLGGNLSDPVINAALRGTGALTGGLRLDAAPVKGRFEVRSDLSFAGVTTDVEVRVAEGSTQARGQVRYQDLVLFLADEDGGAVLTGAGRLDGWSVAVEPDLSGATVRGELTRLVPGGSGTVDLTFGATSDGGADAPWLRGSVAGLELSGQALGDVSLTSASPGDVITLAGEAVTATFAPASSAWTLALDSQRVPGDITVSVTGSGRGASGSVAGSAVGDGTIPLAVDFTAELQDHITVTAAGTVMGGQLSLAGKRPAESGEWSGTLSLEGAAYGGVEVGAAGSLQGGDLVPQALLTTSVTSAPRQEDPGPDADPAAFSAAGLISIGMGGVTIDQVLDVAALDEPVRVRGRVTSPTDLVVSGAGADSWRLIGGGAGLRATGSMTLDVGPATVTLGASGGAAVPTVTVALASTPNLAASTELVASDLLDLVASVNAEGLQFSGARSTRGTLTLVLSPEPTLVLHDFAADVSGFDVEVSGTASTSGADLTGTLTLPADVPALSNGGALSLPLHLIGDMDRWRLTSDGELGTLAASFDLDSQEVVVDVDLALPGAAADAAASIERGISSGSVVGRVVYDPAAGARGTFAIADVVLAPAGIGAVTMNAEAAIADGRIGGAASIDTTGGSVTLTGDAALAELLPGVALGGPGDVRGSNLELRVRTLDLGLLPGISSGVPHLDGAVSGVVQLRNGVVVGQLVAPDLAVGERSLPASLQLSGAPASIDIALILAGTLISADLDGGRVTGSARLERFPLELLGEAFVGPTDVSAALTGVLRFDVPLDDPAGAFVRVATEEIRLERADVVTVGNVTMTYDDRSLDVERAEFGGQGAWRAEGVLSPELLDFTLEAVEADFSPLLGLVPGLARFAVGAAGSFTFTASGSFAAPQVDLESDALDIGLAGSRYRIEDTSASLSGVDLTASTTIRGLDPLVGALDFSGAATVMLEPLALRFVDFGFAGSLSVPGVGVVEDITGTIGQDAQNNPTLDLTGTLGAPLRVTGTLVPLDLRAGGTGLDLSFPALLIGDATASIDLSLQSVEGGLELGGSIVADEIVLDPGARNAASAAGSAGSPGSASDVSAAELSALATSDAVAATEAQGARNALAALRFDDLRITAPQRVVLAMNIATIEAALDLTLSGTAAEPQLAGTAEALRGSLRFSGREFTLDSGVATFSPNRGVFPDVAIAARTEFEKSRVLSGAQGVRFVSPAEGQTFTVALAINGPVEAAPADEGGFRFDVRPVLTSEALVEIEGEGVGTGVRALTEAELLSLITLGRVEFGSDLIGAGGIGGAVAQGALDTAVDLLIVGELQNALREALGLDVVEIRTSALSSLLEGDTDQFGVSVRLGGYLNPELFASYRIGTADAGDASFGVTNEVALSYALGPLDLDILGRIDFPAAGTLASPRPELGLGLRYDFGRTLGIDAGVTLSTDRSVVSFGVALRW